MNLRQLSHTGPLWPASLRLPIRPPKLIYLDLNHWIELSKAYSGHQDGLKHRYIFDACIKAVRDGKAVFPLSIFIYTEIGKIKHHRQRRDLQAVIEQISRYMVVTSAGIVARHEVEATLDRVVGPNPVPINTANYLDWGVSRAFGMVGGFKIHSSSGEDVTEKARHAYMHGPEAFDMLLFNAERELNRRVIEGPALQEEPKLRSLGWKPEASVQTFQEKASEELDLIGRLDMYPNLRGGRLRDVFAAREALIEIGDIFAEGFAARGGYSALLQFFSRKRDELSSIYNAMPSFDVAVTLKTSFHSNPNHYWKNNHIFDIRALALTVPYCDIVVTDREMWAHLTRNKIPGRYDTVVIPNLTELINHL